MNNKEWDNEGCRRFLPAMDAFYEMLEDEFDDLTEEGVDAKVEFTTKASRNFIRPTL